MRQPNGKIIARSVGYRIGKNHPLDRPDFSRIFVPELVQEAEQGYEAGVRFEWARAKVLPSPNKYNT